MTSWHLPNLAPLVVFFLVTFGFTWWIRGRGFREWYFWRPADRGEASDRLDDRP